MRKKALIFVSIVPIFLLISGVFVFENKKNIYNGNFFKDKINISDIFSKKEKIKNEEIKMLFFGDLMLDRDVKAKIKQKELEYILGKLKRESLFSGYDIVSANLEGTVTDDGKYYWPKKQFDFAFLPKDVLELKKYNFNFFNLANNHSYDQGKEGVFQTKENLKNMNYQFSGCMAGFKETCSGTILEIKGKKVAMVGFSLFNGFDLKKAKDIILKLKIKKKADIVVVNIHWGEEYKIQFNKKQQEIARRLIDSGVDIIVGHHPHMVEGVEKYKGKYIFYSLGNFIFDQYFSDEVKTGLAVGINFKKDIVSFRLYPIFSEWIQLGLLKNKQKSKFMKKLSERSIGDDAFKMQIQKGEF
jgi:poly-gamma-glutamate synthesis protein (capsule biosynthesis protein)